MLKVIAKSGAAKKRGFALLVTFFAFILLTAIISEVAFTTGIEYLAAKHSNVDMRAYFAARGAIPLAVTILRKDYKNNKNDSLNDIWALVYKPLDLQDGTVDVTISDEQGKYNLNRLITSDLEVKPKERQAFRRLIEGLNGGEGLNYDYFENLDGPDDIVNRICDYADGDESGDFETEACANNVILSMTELLSIEDFTYELVFGSSDVLLAGIEEEDEFDEDDEYIDYTETYEEIYAATPLKEEGSQEDAETWPGLVHYLTVMSGADGLININTAPEEVLLTLSPNLDKDIAAAVKAYRESTVTPEETDTVSGWSGEGEETEVTYQVYKSVRDLTKVEGVDKKAMQNLLKELAGKKNRRITVRSHYFAADVAVRIGEKTFRYRAIVQRTPAGVLPLTWKEIRRKPEIRNED